ncbi:MAG: hypothetical protein ACFCU5_02840 [Pleurocapsa sp.]
MKSETQLILLFLGIPLAGLVYCGLGIAAMANLVMVREHALIAGAIFILIPFTIAASIWISASAKAYRK